MNSGTTLAMNRNLNTPRRRMPGAFESHQNSPSSSPLPPRKRAKRPAPVIDLTKDEDDDENLEISKKKDKISTTTQRKSPRNTISSSTTPSQSPEPPSPSLTRTALSSVSSTASSTMDFLKDSQIPTHIATYFQQTRETLGTKASEIDWLQIPLDIATWISENPELAKKVGYGVVGGAVLLRPSLVTGLVWNVGVAGKSIYSSQ